MSYCYNGMLGLSAGELFFWIMVDKALQQLGVQDVAAMFAIIAGQPNPSYPRKVLWCDERYISRFGRCSTHFKL